MHEGSVRMLRQGKSSAAAVPLAPGQGLGATMHARIGKPTTWLMTPGGSAQALPVRARTHPVTIAGCSFQVALTPAGRTTLLRWGSKETKEVREACGPSPGPTNCGTGNTRTREAASVVFLKYRGTPR